MEFHQQGLLNMWSEGIFKGAADTAIITPPFRKLLHQAVLDVKESENISNDDKLNLFAAILMDMFIY